MGIKISYVRIRWAWGDLHTFKESHAFALIEYLFFNVDSFTNIFAEKFDLSYHPFYRSIRTINQKFQTKYNVKDYILKPLELVKIL